jgi:glycosyltransferase involved in cell wall biosynthesis
MPPRVGGSSTVRIGLEGSDFAAPATGVGQYVRALWRELQEQPGLEPVLLLPGRLDDYPDPPAGEVIIEAPPQRWATGKTRKLWWEQVGLPQAAGRARLDLVHAPHFRLPVRRAQPYIVTIHDLVPLVMPVYANSRSMRLYLRLACATAPRAHLILTDSEHSAQDIRRFLRVPEERIRVVPLAAGAAYRPLPPDSPALTAAREKYDLAGPFIFNVAGLDVRKNLVALVRGFALARTQLPAGIHLAIAGAAHSDHPDRYPDLAPIVSECGLEEWVTFTGRISDEEKVALLNAAELYVDASLYEGFGLSPLEAMSCGTPTVCSDRSSLPEVTGDGALSIEPTPEKLGAAIAFVLSAPHERRELRRRGLAQAARFSWQRTTAETIAAYQETLASTQNGSRGALKHRKAGTPS